ncbi:HIT family protein [Actinoplanes sp. NPDC049802]|uniref:HIT family protein n=1 Tax=Actinoplanes sp. NPDC049802 TaxID=3154742 RepID=UPI0033C1714F
MADCVFCGIVAGSIPAFLVASSPAGLAFLDIRPVFKGHVLVIPRPHIVTLPDLPSDDIAEYFRFVQLLSAAVPVATGARGTFVAVNNVVSQSVPHLHTHVVPRTKGDGLKGFFWPRRKYADDEEATGIAAAIGKEYTRLSVAETGRRE